MGKLIVEQIISADGFAADKDGGIGFFENDAGDFSEMEDDQLELLSHVDAIVLGANTYRMFVKYWPTADPKKERVAEFINSRPKHVISSTLDAAPWGKLAPATVEKGDAVSSVSALRDRYQNDLIIWGSLKLTEALFRAKLVDRLRLRSVPVLIGAGRSVAPADLGQTTMKLVTAKGFPRGHVLQDYALR